MSTDLAPLHPEANGFKLFRALPDGRARDYTGVEFVKGWHGAERFLRQLRAFGFVRNPAAGDGSYGILDVLNRDDDIVQDYAVPTAEAFRYIKRKLQLRVVSEDPAGEPQPTPAQWAMLEEALRRTNGRVTETYGRGAPRRIPALRRRGWVDDNADLTVAGRHVARGWSYDTATGKLYVDHRCWRCKTAVAVGQCCSSHGKDMCHACYRLTHFVERCVEGCTECAEEGLPFIYPVQNPLAAAAVGGAR